MADFTMPALGADMETGKLVQWYVKPGDTVHSGDVVAVVETHKGAIDVECFLEGTIDHLAPLGAEMPVGGVLATVLGAEAAVMDARAPQKLKSPHCHSLRQPSRPSLLQAAADSSVRQRDARPVNWAWPWSKCTAPAKTVPSRWPMWSWPADSHTRQRECPLPQRTGLRPGRLVRQVLILRKCARPLLRPWASPNAKSRITT